MLTDLEKKIIASIQEDMAVTKRPYLKISEKLGISEETLLETLRDLSERGIIRRFGATLRHQKTGFTANAMAAWQVDEDRIEAVGSSMAAFNSPSRSQPPKHPAPRHPDVWGLSPAPSRPSCRRTHA